TLVATGLPFVLTVLGMHGDRPVLIGLSLLVGLSLPVLALVTVRHVPEPRHTKHEPVPFLAGLMAMWGNAPFRRLLVAFA
ncbi:hypothetical protein J8J27_34010, partial [Mycobacterium tuberculosis]|nr:hypothetical protein [Mycobacterium tuberculosis]